MQPCRQRQEAKVTGTSLSCSYQVNSTYSGMISHQNIPTMTCSHRVDRRLTTWKQPKTVKCPCSGSAAAGMGTAARRGRWCRAIAVAGKPGGRSWATGGLYKRAARVAVVTPSAIAWAPVEEVSQTLLPFIFRVTLMDRRKLS